MNIWIGYDNQFKDNIDVQIKSIKKFASKNLNINLIPNNLITRKREPTQSTTTAFSRWLVPYLSNYSGWNLYMDSDMMLRSDITKLWELIDPDKSVMVVKHNVDHKKQTKFNNHIQSNYERKNWSSLILFNCNKCKQLDLNYINTAKGLDLHQFKWLNDGEIGSLPLEWNHLVGLNEPNNNAKLIHWTLGGPWFVEYSNVEFSEEWQKLKFI